MTVMMLFALAACGGETQDNENGDDTNVTATGVEDGVLTVGMECQYAPYNWTQMTDENGAVAIANNPGSYANGYDVMIAKKIGVGIGHFPIYPPAILKESTRI